MKKLIMFIVAMCLMMPVAVYADQAKDLRKARERELKDKKKEYKKDGWKLFGSSRSLDVALLSHYDKLNTLGENAKVITGFASRFKSKNVGKQMAMNSACMDYAQRAGSTLKGRVVSDMAGNAIDEGAEMEKFYAAYERLVEQEIKNVLDESYAVIHENGDGTYELQVFFIVNEDAASRARERAYQNAMNETAAAKKYAEQISEFVREGFEIE